MQADLFANAGGAPVRPRREDEAPVGDPLPSASPAPDGRGRRDTSRAAYAEHRDSGKLNNNQARIVGLLKANPGRDYTRSEIGQALGMPINVVAGRTNELINVKRAVEEKRRRTCAVTGKTVYAVGLK